MPEWQNEGAKLAFITFGGFFDIQVERMAAGEPRTATSLL
jgi:hypothetical protein